MSGNFPVDSVNGVASFWWLFGPLSAYGSIESTTINTTHPTLQNWIEECCTQRIPNSESSVAVWYVSHIISGCSCSLTDARKLNKRVTESNPPGWEPVWEQGRLEITCKTYQTATLGSENLRVQYFTILIKISPDEVMHSNMFDL